MNSYRPPPAGKFRVSRVVSPFLTFKNKSWGILFWEKSPLSTEGVPQDAKASLKPQAHASFSYNGCGRYFLNPKPYIPYTYRRLPFLLQCEAKKGAKVVDFSWMSPRNSRCQVKG